MYYVKAPPNNLHIHLFVSSLINKVHCFVLKCIYELLYIDPLNLCSLPAIGKLKYLPIKGSTKAGNYG